MFGGGMSSTMSGSSVAERNLDRFTVAVGMIWGAAIVGLQLIERFNA
jgi:preprotein translocase subunit SecG